MWRLLRARIALLGLTILGLVPHWMLLVRLAWLERTGLAQAQWSPRSACIARPGRTIPESRPQRLGVAPPACLGLMELGLGQHLNWFVCTVLQGLILLVPRATCLQFALLVSPGHTTLGVGAHQLKPAPPANLGPMELELEPQLPRSVCFAQLVLIIQGVGPHY